MFSQWKRECLLFFTHSLLKKSFIYHILSYKRHSSFWLPHNITCHEDKAHMRHTSNDRLCSPFTCVICPANTTTTIVWFLTSIYDRMWMKLLLGDSRLSRKRLEAINKWEVLLERIGLVSAETLIISRAYSGCAMAVLDFSSFLWMAAKSIIAALQEWGNESNSVLCWCLGFLSCDTYWCDLVWGRSGLGMLLRSWIFFSVCFQGNSAKESITGLCFMCMWFSSTLCTLFESCGYRYVK